MTTILLVLIVFGVLVLIAATYEVIINKPDTDKPTNSPKEQQKETLD